MTLRPAARIVLALRADDLVDLGLLLLLAFTVTALGVLVAVWIKQAQTFTAVMQMFVFPMFFLFGALYPCPSWRPGWAC